MMIMRFQIHVILIIFFVVSIATLTSCSAPPPNCPKRCGSVSIPFPFGMTPGCYQSHSFSIACNKSFTPHKPFLAMNPTVEITEISLQGQLRLLNFIAHDCYHPNGTTKSHNDPWLTLPEQFTVSNTANKFTIVGCDGNGYVYGRRLDGRFFQTGCSAMCSAVGDLAQGSSCSGMGCCQISIPEDVSTLELRLASFNNYSHVSGLKSCSFAFVVEERAFTFSHDNLTNLMDVQMQLPMVIDWAIGNGTCEEARMNTTGYACKSVNSKCNNTSNGKGYRCSCKEGYQGNPYLGNGCQDIDECLHPRLSMCKDKCVNTPGGFYCTCPKGYRYRGSGKINESACISTSYMAYIYVYNHAAGIALGVSFMLLVALVLLLALQRRRLIRLRRTLFVQNGGMLLQEQLRSSSPDAARIFSEVELQKATHNFNNNMIVGRGGFGTVYKGVLPNNTTVAIKKSKAADPNQVEQFVNEVLVLSQINHRNVVKLLGCCLETQVPLLVYEFVGNGTLFEHVHDKEKARALPWDARLKIATETAGALSYLHFSASTPIIHRDVKSANILLDHTYTAKVADFGASRFVPLGQTRVSTRVQGTFGYLDPEYMQTSQLTNKSDVFSFGVLLVELLTGMKALSYDRPEDERSLASLFLSVMEQDRLFQILDEVVAREENKEQAIQVAELARGCLGFKGDNRPSMREVVLQLEGARA